MEENKRPVHSVDDYYPKPSDFSDDMPDDEMKSANPEFDDTQSGGENDRGSGYFYTDSHDSGFHDGSQADEQASSDGSDRSYEFHEEKDPHDVLTCPHCGNQVPASMNFCSLCGYHFPKAQDTPYQLNDVRLEGYLVDDIASFVGVNYATYLNKFQKISEGRISFNWAAALFSNRWMAYRGMFRIALLFSLVLNTISGILSYMILMMFQSLGTQLTDAIYDRLSMFSILLTIAIGLVVGLIGDSLYWKHTKKAMNRFNCKDREPISNLRIARSLKAMGGCKIGYALLIIVFDLSFNEMITYLLQYLIS